jgi:hypothetical protein
MSFEEEQRNVRLQDEIERLKIRSFEREEECADFVCRAIAEGASFSEAIAAWKKGPRGV